MPKISLNRDNIISKLTLSPKMKRLGIFLLVMIISFGVISRLFVDDVAAGWYDEGWAYRKKLTINNAYVSGSSDLTDFPVLVSLSSDTDLSAGAQADGDDIMFVDEGGNKLDHEIESYSSGTLTAWVRIPTLHATEDTTFYMYYGNPSVANQEDAKGVWNDNFYAVYHLNETVTDEATGGTHVDSTGNGYDGSQIENSRVSAQISGGQFFDDTDDDYIQTAVGDAINGRTTLTIEAWMRRTNTGWPNTVDIGNETSAYDDGVSIQMFNDGYVYFAVGTGEPVRFANSNTSWHHVSMIYNGALGDNQKIKAIFDGSNQSLSSNTNVPSTADTQGLPFIIGGTNPSNSEMSYNAEIDEVRVYSNAVSSEWAITSYNTQNSPATFFSADTQEKGPGPVAYWKFDEGSGNVVFNSATAKINVGLPQSTLSSPINIDNVSDFGAMLGNGRQVVRISNGNLYAALDDGGTCEIWKSTDAGSSWTQIDSSNSPTCNGNFALVADKSDNIHIIYAVDGTPDDLWYNIISTSSDLFGTAENVTNFGGTQQIYELSLALDNNNVPHIAFEILNSSYYTLYRNKVGGSWNSRNVKIASSSFLGNSISINKDNIPEISVVNVQTSELDVFTGDANNPTTLTEYSPDTAINTTSNTGGSSLAIDSAGNTWVAYIDVTTNYVTLYEFDYGTTWTTAGNWHQYSNSNVGSEPSIVINGTDVYVFYTDDASDIVYDMYNGSSWLGETPLQTGTYQDVKTKWSLLHNYFGGSQIDYLFSDATDVYYDRVSLGGTPTWQTEDMCISGKCLWFDGSDDVASSVNTDSIDFDIGLDGGFSMSMWVKANSDGENNVGEIFSKGSNTYLRVDSEGSDGLADLEFNLDLGTTDANVNVANGITLNKWHQITITHDGSSSIEVFIDGISKGSDTGSGTMSADNYNLLIGGSSSANFHGFIDDFKIFNYERSAEQIKTGLIKGASASGSVASFGPDDSYLSDGLVGYWKMDESGLNGCGTNDLCDSSGNNFDGAETGTMTNSDWIAGKYGNAVDFDGTDDEFSIPDNDALDLVDDWTISGWVYDSEASLNHDWDYFVTKGNVYGGSDMPYSVGIGYNQLFVDSEPGGTPNDESIYIDSYVTSQEWFHFAVVMDDVQNIVKYYINGEYIGSDPFDVNAVGNTSSLYIGADSSGNQWYGYMDEVRMYNRALSSSEVQKLYTWAPGPIAYYPLDENTGISTTHDKSGNGYDGTLESSMTEGDWVPGKYGSALDMDGSDDEIDTSMPSSDIITETAITISAWFTSDDAGNMGNSSVVSQYITSFRRSANNPVLSLALDNNHLAAQWWYDSGSNTGLEGTTTLSPNTWYHGTLTYDGTDVKIYLNGVLENSATLTGPLYSFTTDTVVLGDANDTLNSGPLDGYIDEVKIYDYVRTQSQIIEDMNAGHPIGGSPIGSQVAYWKFDENYGDTANDSRSYYNGDLGGPASSCPGGSNCPSWTPNGKINSALDFNGSDSAIYFCSYPYTGCEAFNATERFSITAWIKSDVASGSGGGIMGVSSAGQIQYLLGVNDTLYANIDGTTVSGSTDITSSGATWYHVAITWDKDQNGGKITLYVDGKEDGSNTRTTAAVDKWQDVLIGWTTGLNFFNGIIDEVKFYSAALTPAQVLIDYNANAAINFGTGYDEADQIEGGAPSGLIGYWNIDENTGSSLQDISGNGYTGTLTNSPTYVPGVYGSALNFTSSTSDNDYVNIADADDLDLTGGNFTISAWINPTGWGESNQGRIIDHGGGTGDGWAFHIDTNDKLLLQIDNYLYHTCSSCPVTLGQWQHVAVTHTSGGTVKHYVNGVLYNTTTGSSSPTATTDPIRIGLRSNDTNRDFDGQIDEVKVFNTTLTPAQVAYDYNRGKPVGWWRFDECAGATAYDASGNGSNGTITPGTGTPPENTAVGACSSGNNYEMWNDGTTGKFNASLDFDGTDDYVSIGDIDFSNDFSATVWFKADTTTGYRSVFSKANDFWMEFESNGNFRAAVGSTPDEANMPGLNTGTWYHAAMTWDEGTNTISLYINGQLVDSATGGSNHTPNNNTLYVGSWNGASEYHNGQIDDFRIFNYKLSEDQVKNIMNDGIARFD